MSHLNEISHFSTHIIISLSDWHDKTNIAHWKPFSCQGTLDQCRLQISTGHFQGNSKLIIRRLTSQSFLQPNVLHGLIETGWDIFNSFEKQHHNTIIARYPSNSYVLPSSSHALLISVNNQTLNFVPVFEINEFIEAHKQLRQSKIDCLGTWLL